MSNKYEGKPCVRCGNTERYKLRDRCVFCAKRYHRERRLNREYGITLEDYENQLLFQGEVCAICEQDETEELRKNLCVDHNHDTGEVRGLLCAKCNRSIAALEDKDWLEKAKKYLRYDLEPWEKDYDFTNCDLPCTERAVEISKELARCLERDSRQNSHS